MRLCVWGYEPDVECQLSCPKPSAFKSLGIPYSLGDHRIVPYCGRLLYLTAFETPLAELRFWDFGRLLAVTIATTYDSDGRGTGPVTTAGWILISRS